MTTELYASEADVRTAMNMTSDSNDGQLRAYLSAACRMIDAYCGYTDVGFQAVQTATARVYAGNGFNYLWIDPCIEITGVAFKDSLSDVTYDTVLTSAMWRGFRGSVERPEFNITPYTGIMLTSTSTQGKFTRYSFDSVNTPSASEPNVQITARWGYADSVPEPIKTAAIMQTVRIYKRLQGGMADALLNTDLGQSQYLSKLDKDVQVLLNFSGLRRPKFGGK